MKLKQQDLPQILTTADAATFLNRRPQTLRKWACEGSGPIQPIRISGRLGWRVADIRQLIEGDGERGGRAA